MWSRGVSVAGVTVMNPAADRGFCWAKASSSFAVVKSVDRSEMSSAQNHPIACELT